MHRLDLGKRVEPDLELGQVMALAVELGTGQVMAMEAGPMALGNQEIEDRSPLKKLFHLSSNPSLKPSLNLFRSSHKPKKHPRKNHQNAFQTAT